MFSARHSRLSLRLPWRPDGTFGLALSLACLFIIASAFLGDGFLGPRFQPSSSPLAVSDSQASGQITNNYLNDCQTAFTNDGSLTFIIHSGDEGNGQSDGVRALKETWLNFGSLRYSAMIYITNDPSDEMRDLLAKVSQRVRPGLVPEHVNNMNERVMQSLIHAHIMMPATEWYLRIYEGVFVHLENLQALLKEFAASQYPDPMSNPYYIGDCSCKISADDDMCHQRMECADSVTIACSQPGYLLSWKALELLVHYEQRYGAYRSYEHQMIGHSMAMLGIPCHDDHRLLRLNSWGILTDNEKDVWGSVAVISPADPSRIRRLNQLKNTDGWFSQEVTGN